MADKCEIIDQMRTFVTFDQMNKNILKSFNFTDPVCS